MSFRNFKINNVNKGQNKFKERYNVPFTFSPLLQATKYKHNEEVFQNYVQARDNWIII